MRIGHVGDILLGLFFFALRHRTGLFSYEEVIILLGKKIQLIPYLDLHSQHVVIENDKLRIQNARMQEDGVYQCVAENKHGMLVSSTWINIRGE